MPPPPRNFVKHICSSSASASELIPTPTAVSAAASLAVATVLRAPRFQSRLLPLLPHALLFHPSCVRLTLSRLLPSPIPTLRFLLFLSSHLPAPDATPDRSPSLHGLDDFLLQLPPPLAAAAAALLASHLGLHLSLPALYAASLAALRPPRRAPQPRLPPLLHLLLLPGLPRRRRHCRLPRARLRHRPPSARWPTPPSPAAAADIVAAFAAAGNFAKVSETLHLMIAAGCPPDTVVYQRIMHGLFVHGMGGEALRIFSEIKLRGYNIDAITYTTVINGLCKLGPIAHAWLMWDEMPIALLSITTVKLVISGWLLGK